MIKLVCYLLVFVFILSGCDRAKKPKKEEGNIRPNHFSQSYEPPSFIEDHRRQTLLGLEPEIQELIENHAQERHIPGVAWGLVIDDELLLSGATGLMNLEENLPATPTSCFRIASMTKSFTAMAILKLRDEGKLSLDDPAEKYIPEMKDLEYPTSDSPLIDIENLLTMTAGFPEDNPWGDRQLDEPDQRLVDLIEKGLSFSNPPSVGYEYSNTGYALLGFIITRVSGQPFQEYIREHILQPLEMTNTFWEYDNVPNDKLALGYRWEDDRWKLEPILHDGSYGAMGGLITTIEDFASYVSLHLSAWPPRSDPDNGPVKRSTLREMHTPYFSRLYEAARDYKGDLCPVLSGYGYGLGINENCHGIVQVSHGGALPGYGSNYLFFPDYGIGLMAFGNLTYTSPWPLEKIRKLLFDDNDLEKRELPVSDILNKRKMQVTGLIKNWDPELERDILAENFYLDKSKKHRMAEIKKVLGKAGEIQGVGDMVPDNQLRGGFEMYAEKGIIHVYFTLTPESDPKVQALYISFESKGSSE